MFGIVDALAFVRGGILDGFVVINDFNQIRQHDQWVIINVEPAFAPGNSSVPATIPLASLTLGDLWFKNRLAGLIRLSQRFRAIQIPTIKSNRMPGQQCSTEGGGLFHLRSFDSDS